MYRYYFRSDKSGGFFGFFKIFFTYIKMSKDSSAKNYQDNKERLQKKARERYQSLSNEGKVKEIFSLGEKLCFLEGSKIRPEKFVKIHKYFEL